MSKKANPTTVGMFVIGAVLLAIAGILTFSKSSFFTHEQTFVAYFDSSVDGLDVGAPVLVLGVQVGTVSGIKGVIDPGTLDIKVPVYLKLDRDALGTTRELTKEEERVPLERSLEILIGRGLRAELRQQSLVTGKLFVAFVFAPQSEVHYHGDDEYFEIPTTQGGLAKLAKNLEDIDIEGLVSSGTEAARAIEELARNPELEELIHGLNELAKRLDAELGPLSDSARTLMADATTLVKDADREVLELSDSAEELIRRLDGDREELAALAREVLQGLAALDSDHTMSQRTGAMLDEITGAARSIRLLAEFLERHPEALIKGKN